MTDEPTRQQRWRRLNPNRYRAHLAVEAAIRRGDLIKQPCAECGTTENIDFHHPDYSKPLHGIFLCRRHHVRLHRQLAEQR